MLHREIGLLRYFPAPLWKQTPDYEDYLKGTGDYPNRGNVVDLSGSINGGR